MLTEREKQFIQYWEAVRLREKKWQRQLLTGIPIGLLFALPIIAIVFTAKYWYLRADMMTMLINPLVLVIAILLMSTFMAIFYKQYQWDRKEQQYRQLKAREEAEVKGGVA